MPLDFRPSPIHGTGGFAVRAIAPGERIIEYLGERIDKKESRRQCRANNPFIFYLSPEADLNGDVSWNPARYLNHSCEPNAEAEQIDGHIWIVARREIRAGEEVTFNYGYDLERYRDYPCSCGANRCVGYMVSEEYHAELR